MIEIVRDFVNELIEIEKFYKNCFNKKPDRKFWNHWANSNQKEKLRIVFELSDKCEGVF